MNNKRPYIIQFVCILTMLIAIMLQGFTHVVKMKPLSSIDQVKDWNIKPTFENYLNGSYQTYLTGKAKRNTGFREFFIRNYNQLVYSCFGKSTNLHVKEGLNHELYLKMYLNEVTGKTLEEKCGSVEEAKAQAQV